MPGLIVLFAVALVLVIALATAAVARAVVHPPRLTFAAALARKLPTDPIEAGAASYETAHVAAVDGGAIELWDIEGRHAAGPVVVVVHGWGQSRYAALARYEAVASEASRVIVYDLGGHGESIRRGFRWDDSEIENLLGVLMWTAERYPQWLRIVVGESIGATIAARAAEVAEDGLIAGVKALAPAEGPAEIAARTCRAMGLPPRPIAPVVTALQSRKRLARARP